MTERTCLAVVLAAGEGTRMKSERSKVLHAVAGLPMIGHVVAAVEAAGVEDVALVIGRDGDAVSAAASSGAARISTHLQTERLGTGHAVLAAREAIARGYDDVLVLFGDTPLLLPDTLKAARAALADGADVTVIGFNTDKPTGYGRLLERDGALVAIREEKDASEKERAVTFCNGGLMAIRGGDALTLIDAIGNDNAKGEYYLTDIVEIVRARGGSAVAIEAPAEQLMGVNTRAELAVAEAVWQARRRQTLMLSGVTMIAPETVFLAHDTVIEPDAVIEPNVVFASGVTVRGGAVIHPFCHIEQSEIGPGAQIGPFARLRPGSKLGAGSKVGNFCEVKKSVVGEGAKINHLSYIGDAQIGAKANIGAGTITCNYDGTNKHLTEIGAGVFVGSNTSLVAPVSIGEGAYIASGSVITENVEADALALARARQTAKPGRARDIRARNAALKERKQGKS
ncbi:bifunctional UDP-N-acetylglucosamine diphosphorylase/glucosamine-1-phosphate N-acetyltransferase GlmU [Pararhizobium haloflavum]|uniref:bifunctional UDP-N-acetylglucosamine diphosphorylase/glucosamine-1-phosphate N-acetyltransferase GlmU n=1 Tax=Pararhizobium haloflavum TaxID=2037914 RepID=UPI000C18CE58|nr:bifunctional UDP-N-acetylglucosamine diphosphorylase/glucosamine-1-phosphate N-acetyltransferase GlmU [Pararhizobium haloflavum]